MKRAVMFFAAMIFAFGLPFSAAQAAETVEAGPIWNQQDAEKKCPSVCEKRGGWTGHWWTTVQGKMSVCQCKGASDKLEGNYIIRSTHGCPNGKWCNAELSWDGAKPHPMASVEFEDRVEWKFEAVPGKANHYIIRSTYGCPNDQWCNAELSWDGAKPHPMASVEFEDRVEWKVESVPGKANHYIIRSTHGCPNGQWCNAELSWDGTKSHPMASVEFGDRVEWEIIKSAQCKEHVTDIQLTASNTGTPRPGPKGYTRIGDWDVDAGGSKGTDGSTGHWRMALYTNKEKSLTENSTCVTDVQLRASSSSTAPKGPAGYKQIGYWDVDGGGSHGTDGSTGHWMMAMYANTATISSETQCVTDVQLTASNTATPRPGPKDSTRIGDWDVDAGGSHGTDGSTGHWRMALYVNKAAISAPKPAPKPAPKFSCEDKRNCGTMGSCEEAYYHLNTCGNKRLDNDQDGIPCESICPDDK